MGWLVIGFFAGAFFVGMLLAASGYQDGEFERYRNEYRYNYTDLLKAWRDGSDGKPPCPPPPN